jgi:hypothetical protein
VKRRDTPTTRGVAGKAASTKDLLFVDAIEDEYARLLLGVEAFDVPTRLLPKGAKEGTWLRLTMRLTVPPPDEGAAIRRRLGRGDDGRDIKL